MAADVAVKHPPANPCCTVWKEKCTKLEAGRKHLRQAVQILNEQIDKIQAENASLKKAYEEERVLAEIEKESKEKELAVRIALEKDLSSLKSELNSLKEKGSATSGEETGEGKLLQDHVSKAEKEITQLKALLEKERERANSEKSNAEMQKRSATEAWEQLNVEKARADEERKRVNIKGKQAEEYSLQLEILRKGIDEAKAKLVSETLKFEEACKKLETEKHKVIKERKLAESGMAKAEEQKKHAEANGKKAMEEKSRAEQLSQLLENARQKICDLQKEIAEKAKVEKGRKNATTEWKKAEEYRTRLELLRKDSDETNAKLRSEILKFEEVNKRLEIEKNRASKERKRADSEMAKAKELGKVVETNWKLALEEKTRADQLSVQLEESRHKIEKLQKQMQELLPARNTVDSAVVLTDKDVKAETIKLKLLEKQLKIEKMRLRYAKQMAKLEQNRSGILQQELGRIKLDSIHISQRLDALDKWFTSSVEYIEGLEKAGVTSKMQRSKLKRKFDDLGPSEMYAQIERELSKPSGMVTDAFYPFRHPLCGTAPWLPVPGKNCYEPISGIDSKLKSLHGGFYRKLLQRSAINSSSGSFSDGQSVGSQEAFVSTSEKLAGENSDVQATTSGLSGEVTNMHCDKNLALVPEKCARSPLSVDTSGGGHGHGKKWKRMLNVIESVEFLHSQSKKLDMQMEERLSVLHDMLNRGSQKPTAEPKHVDGKVWDSTFAKCEKSFKKRKVPFAKCEKSFKKRNVLQHEQDKIQIGNKVQEDANALRLAGHSVSNQLGMPNECNYSEFHCKTIAGDEKLETEDFMKLLDLDDSADEECYRKAMEMPLSPTLPEIEISTAEICDTNNIKAGDIFMRELSNEKEIVVPSCRFDAIDTEISFSNLTCDALRASFSVLLHETENSSDKFGSGNGCCNTVEAQRASDGQTKVFEVGKMLKNCTSSEELKFVNLSSECKLESAHDNIPMYYVVFSNDTNDYNSVSRIFCATRSCLVHCSLDSEAEYLVQKILHVLKTEEKLLPKEKACALFSLLLLNISANDFGRAGNHTHENFKLLLDSLAGQIIRVMSDAKSRSVFASLCCLDELLSLIEDFLINGRVIVCTDLSSEISFESDSRMNISMNGININLSSKQALADQLVAGSIILASICVAVDRIEFICEASYKLLRIRNQDIDILLAILHVLAYLGGDRFFLLKEYELTMKALNLLIIYLEGRIGSVASDSLCFSSLHAAGVKFHPFLKCPFGTVSVDTVISELLEKLKSCSFSITMHQNPLEFANASIYHGLSHKSSANQCSSHEDESCGLDGNCDVSCSLNKCVMPAAHFHVASVWNGALCYFSDILSLVELLACYMNWEWTCVKIIPALLEILGRPMLDDFAVAVVVLLGQLGRFGVAACGYEDKEVENLKYKLAGFLQQGTTAKLSLTVQIAAVTSLLGILPFDFEDIIQSNVKLPEYASQFFFSDVIRNWFSSQSKEQQTLSSSLLQPACKVNASLH